MPSCFDHTTYPSLFSLEKLPPQSDKVRRQSFTTGRQNGRALSTEGSFIPGETEEDGNLRREYVLVDNTRAVEFNRAVDGKSDRVNHIALSLSNAIEISSQPRRPLYDRRVIPTPTTYDYAAEYPLSPPVNSPTISNNGVTSPSIAINNITFPPPPNSNVPPLSSSPSSTASRAATNALNRALSIASKKLFGHSHSHSHSHSSSGHSPSRDLSSAPPSPRRPQIILLEADGERDPLEDELLGLLEELAQKTDVLTHWADEMYEYVKAIPQSKYLPFASLVASDDPH
jgi:serine/threonine-protein kinase ULK/ATG1